MKTPTEIAEEIVKSWNETIEYSYGMSEDNHETLLPKLIESFAAAIAVEREEAELLRAVLSEAGITVEKVDGGYRWKP